MEKEHQLKYDRKKYRMLIASIIFDIIGVLTYIAPVVGEVFDLIWAPVSALLVFIMYRKHYGSVGGVFSFFEEILPGADFIPTFTIMWLLRYYVFEREDSGAKVTAQ